MTEEDYEEWERWQDVKYSQALAAANEDPEEKNL
jgi:hypothetical protein